MEYVIPVVLVILLVAGFVTFLVLNATRKSGPVADTADEGAPGIGADRTPLGDTTEHAGEQTETGETRSDPEAGPGRPFDDPDAAAHVARPGEGEGAERLEFEGDQPRHGDDEDRLPREQPRHGDEEEERLRREEPPRPASERLADRDA